MILLDTNVLIYASDAGSPHHAWARGVIADAVAGDGAAIDAVVLAEICVGDREPAAAAERIRSWGVEILDLPVAAAEACARAFRSYRVRRAEATGEDIPPLPLPDFFIGAHAEVLDCPLATADDRRFSTYFPAVRLLLPRAGPQTLRTGAP
ncbi:MAG TPA: type II toxin-antitoxin system VapC family toxin [Thermoanaerobaculia bacterium]|nr:type II toxin-antitoxin system VapC family toxin [Thermoanaerobaculia bacterium]